MDDKHVMPDFPCPDGRSLKPHPDHLPLKPSPVRSKPMAAYGRRVPPLKNTGPRRQEHPPMCFLPQTNGCVF